MDEIKKQKKLRTLFIAIILIGIIGIIALICVGIKIKRGQPQTADAPEIQAQCEHVYKDGLCTLCGEPCPHNWTDGICEICGMICPHDKWRNGNCMLCGIPCQHPEYVGNLCAECGMPCQHEWENGICIKCGEKCPHSEHTQDTHQCTQCGELVVHHYKNGVCACGKVFEMWSVWEDPTILDEANEKGNIDEIAYEIPVYDGSTIGTFEKVMAVYTPYGYDPSQKYNVIFLYHGGGGDHHDWMDAEIDVGAGNTICMRNVYDNMIEKKMCEPFIAVSLETGCLVPGSSWKRNDNSAWQNAEELKNIVLPYIVEHYSTYAASPNLLDIQDAREHFGIGGDSNGSLFAYWSGMERNFNLFGNYLFISGNAHQEAVKAINKGEWEALPITCFFCGAGDYDDQKHRVQIGYDEMVASTNRLVENSNAFMLGTVFGHDWNTFSVVFSNAIQVMWFT